MASEIMDVEQQFSGAPQPPTSTDILPVTLDGQLPVLPDSGHVDYKTLLPMEASLPRIGALIKHEFTTLTASESPYDDKRADNLRRAAGGIIELANDGHLATMEDVHELVALAEDRNPSMRKVEELLIEQGLTPAEIGFVYEASEIVGTNIGYTDRFFKSLGLNVCNGDDVEMAASLIEEVQAGRNQDPRFKDIAASVVVELVEDGRTLGSILDGRVY